MAFALFYLLIRCLAQMAYCAAYIFAVVVLSPFVSVWRMTRPRRRQHLAIRPDGRGGLMVVLETRSPAILKLGSSPWSTLDRR